MPYFMSTKEQYLWNDKILRNSNNKQQQKRKTKQTPYTENASTLTLALKHHLDLNLVLIYLSPVA